MNLSVHGNKSKYAMLSVTEQIRCRCLASSRFRCWAFVGGQFRCFLAFLMLTEQVGCLNKNKLLAAVNKSL